MAPTPISPAVVAEIMPAPADAAAPAPAAAVVTPKDPAIADPIAGNNCGMINMFECYVIDPLINQ